MPRKDPELRRQYNQERYLRNRILKGRTPKQRRSDDPSHYLCWSAKTRASKRGLAFSLAPEHINVPEVCPVLGIPIERGNKPFHPNSPSVDRVIPALGYVPENICVISMRANALKRDSTLEELEAVLRYMEQEEGAAPKDSPKYTTTSLFATSWQPQIGADGGSSSNLV